MTIPFIEDNDQTRVRREHLEALRRLVGNVYPNRFTRSNVTGEPGGEDTISSVVEKFRGFEPPAATGERPSTRTIETANSELNKISVRVAGRISSPPRVMGKAAFVHLSDGVSQLQIYVRKQDARAIHNTNGLVIDDEGSGWTLFGLLDHGDFIGVTGYLFVTRTGELSLHVEKLQFLAKALLPMPDKMHGIHDPEIRQRQRYADLIAGSLKLEREESERTPREVFELRSKVVREIRRFLDDHGYSEVETPMLSPLATGAAARPFKTHHNALDIDLYARIAPELYLKRLVVGGFEKVYEINRNFRNEGIDRIHNPEFTMLEFYCAYMDVNGMMDFCEELLRAVVFKVTGQKQVRYGEREIDFSDSFKRLTMKEAIAKTWPKRLSEVRVKGEVFNPAFLDDAAKVRALTAMAKSYTKIIGSQGPAIVELSRDEHETNRRMIIPSEDFRPEMGKEYRSAYVSPLPQALLLQSLELDGNAAYDESESLLFENEEQAAVSYAESIVAIFESLTERELTDPTFIKDFPKAISPLSKASPENPAVAERFEFFVGGLETANGFSELNDPQEQYERFREQARQRERGDEEAMPMDDDYIRALSYGMPPAAGIGVGIDRLVMLLANKHSIRDVILFPHLRPERPEQ